MTKSITIAGAGLTGLIAAHAFPSAIVQEASTQEELARNEHAALLRFRSDAVSRITGIPFRRVTVQKSVWDGHGHVPLTLTLANGYARKVLAATGGLLTGRSIWNMAPVERFIAPPDFIARMRSNVETRILYDRPVNLQWQFVPHSQPLVSTIPLPVLLAAAAEHNSWEPERWAHEPAEFKFAEIVVERWRLEGVDLHQTIYLPADDTSTYRASITGDLLIVESISANLVPRVTAEELLSAFGLAGMRCDFVDSRVQRYGKIVDIPAGRRRKLLRQLTEVGNIYTLGRFATWRNVLLDDVAADIEVVRRLMDADAYGRELAA